MTTPDPMTRTELAQAAVWLDRLAEQATTEAKRIKAQLADQARDEYTREGTAPSWRIRDVATIAARVAADRVDVSDPAALAAWATARHPTEVTTRTVTEVRPAFVGRLVKTVRHVGDGAVSDTSGEIVPGLTHRPGGGFLGVSVIPTPEARRIFAGLALEGLRHAAAVAGPVVGRELAELVAAEPIGHLDPGEVGA